MKTIEMLDVIVDKAITYDLPRVVTLVLNKLQMEQFNTDMDSIKHKHVVPDKLYSCIEYGAFTFYIFSTEWLTSKL